MMKGGEARPCSNPDNISLSCASDLMDVSIQSDRQGEGMKLLVRCRVE